MTPIKEINIQEIGQPYHLKIERNSKGYNYEIGIYGESFASIIPELLAAKAQLDKELGISAPAQAAQV